MTPQISFAVAILLFGVMPAVGMCLLFDNAVSDGREQTKRAKIKLIVGLLMMFIPLVVNIVICIIK